MSCDRCGAPCRGRLCRGCEDIQRNEKLHGTAVDDVGRDDTSDNEWSVEQQGLDGEVHEGQATLDGGVAKDGGER
jgi:hypothetical protein